MIEVEVEDRAWTEALPEVEDLAIRAGRAALKSAPHPLSTRRRGPSLQTAEVEELGPRLRGEGGERGGGDEPQLTLLLTDDESVRKLNARFRGKEASTNVLSFPAANSAWPHIGDVALAYGVCAREACGQAKSLQDHLIHLVVHGVLHLLSYDHQTDADAQVMEEIERDVLKGFDIDDPYASRDTHVEL